MVLPGTAKCRPTDEACIQGGIIVWDSYNDHLPGEQNDQGDPISESWIKFIFRNSETEKRLGVPIAEDTCITPGRTIRIKINTVFDDPDDYGYTIDTTEHTVRIAGNDETNGEVVDNGGKCLPVDEGVTEDVPINSAPGFGRLPITLSVDENTDSGEDIGDPVTANDPDNTTQNPNTDTLSYSLTGADAAHFDIDSSTGQIQTDGALDHETKDTYHLAVQVPDGNDIEGNQDSAIDDSIDATISVKDLNEAPAFDSGVPTALNIIENTVAGENIGSPITATDPDDGDTVSYDLDDGDGASFDIDSSGQIKTQDALDKETKDTYNVTVTATGNGGLDDTHAVTITVTEANDPPAFEDENGDVQSATPARLRRTPQLDSPSATLWPPPTWRTTR